MLPPVAGQSGTRRLALPSSVGDGELRHPSSRRFRRSRKIRSQGGPDGPTYPYEAPPSSIASGRQAGAELLAEREWPSAILAVSDALALGVLEAAAARRLRVPEQLSVVGFDDIPAALAAGLTTIRQPAQGTAASPLACSPTPRAPNPARTCCPPS